MSSVVVKVSASAELVKGVRYSEAMVHVACMVLEGGENHFSTPNVSLEEVAGQR